MTRHEDVTTQLILAATLSGKQVVITCASEAEAKKLYDVAAKMAKKKDPS